MFQVLVPLSGVLAGLIVLLGFYLATAPYRQRNEARLRVQTALTDAVSSIAEEVMTQSVIQGRTFRIADLVHGVFHIKDRTFINCAIHGPAVLLIASDVQERRAISSSHFQDCDFGTDDVDTLVWETRGHRINAAIPVIDSVFQRCRFHNIAFIYFADEADLWRNVFRRAIEAQRITYASAQREQIANSLRP